MSEAAHRRVERLLAAGGAGAQQGTLDRCDDDAYLFAVFASLAAGVVTLALRPTPEHREALDADMSEPLVSPR